MSLLKKGFYLGLGAAISGKEKFENVLNDMVKKGEVTPTEAKEMLNSWVSKGEKKNSEWNEQGKARMQDHVKELGFVTREEYELLEARLERLENQNKG
ncbi:phasin family protein [Halobacillus seohaensis]|uniref:Phasin family protein n=1 Tax=Halobacillus seohaensis TaxID=447421 RepID=A0ABW2EN05_9BACI